MTDPRSLDPRVEIACVEDVIEHEIALGALLLVEGELTTDLGRWVAKARAWFQQAEKDQHHFGCGVYPLIDHKPLSACTCGLVELRREIASPGGTTDAR